MLLQMAKLHSFSWLRSIPLYICATSSLSVLLWVEWSLHLYLLWLHTPNREDPMALAVPLSLVSLHSPHPMGLHPLCIPSGDHIPTSWEADWRNTGKPLPRFRVQHDRVHWHPYPRGWYPALGSSMITSIDTLTPGGDNLWLPGSFLLSIGGPPSTAKPQ